MTAVPAHLVTPYLALITLAYLDIGKKATCKLSRPVKTNPGPYKRKRGVEMVSLKEATVDSLAMPPASERWPELCTAFKSPLC